MDKRTAKREACFRAAMMLRTAMEAAPLEENYPDEYDCEKISDAMYVLIEELERRGHA